MNKILELTGRNFFDDNTISLIAEVNIYDENNKLFQQLSRSLFTFPNTMTDEEIITSLKENEYNIYF